MIKTRFGSWGIFLLSLWASVLALVNLARILLLSESAQFLSSNGGPGQGQIWLTFVLNVIFALGFGGSAYGFSKRYNWGRVLFLWLIVIWSGSNLIALFAPKLFYSLFSPNTTLPTSGLLLFSPNPDYTAKELTLNGLRFVVELFLPLWYLNLPHIKMLFRTQPDENFTAEATTNDDTD